MVVSALEGSMNGWIAGADPIKVRYCIPLEKVLISSRTSITAISLITLTVCPVYHLQSINSKINHIVYNIDS